MPKHEDLEFLHEKILNIGNESAILEQKNIPLNKSVIPGEIKDSQVEVEKEILDSGDLLKDITEDFKDTVDIEENFSDMKEEKVDDFLSSLTSSDITSEDDIVGTKQEDDDLDSFDLESIDRLSDGNVIPKNIFEKKDLNESKKDWESLKDESLSDLDLLNMEENETDNKPDDSISSDNSPDQELVDLYSADNGLSDNPSDNYPTDTNPDQEPVIESEKKEDDADISAIFDTEKETDANVPSSSDDFSLDGLIDDKDKKLDSLDDLLKGTENKVTSDPESSESSVKEMDDGLVDLAGDFASQEPVDEDNPQLTNKALSDLFPEEKNDDEGFDKIIEKSEDVEKDDGEIPLDDLLSDFSMDAKPADDKMSVEESPGEEFSTENKESSDIEVEKPIDDFDLSNLDNLSDLQEKEFEVDKHEISEDEISGDGSEGISYQDEQVVEKTNEQIKTDKTRDKGTVLTDADRKQIVTVLSRLPKEAELKIAKAIISGKYSDRELKPLVDVLIAGDKPYSIIRTYERITGDNSLAKIEISKYTGEDFQKYQNSFSYQFKKNILPIISRISLFAAIIISLVAVFILFVEPSYTAWVNYGIGKKNLKEKKFNDVEKYFDKAFAKQKWYNEVVDYGDLYRQFKRYSEAEKKYDLAFSMKPNSTLKMKIADFYRELGRYERSAKLYNEVLYDNDKEIKAYNGIARTYYDWSNEVGDKIADAAEYYTDAVTLDEKNTEAVMGLMNIYIRLKNDRKIKATYEHAEGKLKKIDPGVYADLAGYYIDLEKFDEVKKILTRAAKDSGKTMYPEIDYQWARYKKYLSISSEEKIHLENAVKKLENMRDNDPNRYETARYKLLLASAYNDLGENYDRFAKINIKAEEYFIKTTQVYPEYGKAWYNLGLFELCNKVDYEKALANFRKAEDNGFSDDRQTYLIGWLDYKNSDFLESFGRINSLLEKYPENDNLKLMVGTVFYRMEKYDLAESILKETYDHFDEMKQVRSPLSMSKKADRNIVNMLISLGNNLGATLQKKYEETRSSKYLLSATRYYSSSIENFGRLKEVPDSVLKEEITDEDFSLVKMNKFPVTDVHINLRMVLYPKLGVEDPKIYDDFPLEY